MYVKDEKLDTTRTLRFLETYFRPSLLDELGTGGFFLGQVNAPQEVNDLSFVGGKLWGNKYFFSSHIHSAPDIRNFLFGAPGRGGLDLPALCLWRGRDFGLPLYNEIRDLGGLPRAKSFEEVSSDAFVHEELSDIYDNNVDNLEAIIGSMSEDNTVGIIGATFAQSIINQFTRTRDGDRFHYENQDAGFSTAEQDRITRTTIADIIIRNTKGW